MFGRGELLMLLVVQPLWTTVGQDSLKLNISIPLTHQFCSQMHPQRVCLHGFTKRQVHGTTIYDGPKLKTTQTSIKGECTNKENSWITLYNRALYRDAKKKDYNTKDCHRWNIKQKKPSSKDYILCGSTYAKCNKTGQISLPSGKWAQWFPLEKVMLGGDMSTYWVLVMLKVFI